MKKLTAGIFATILGLTAMGAADAAVTSRAYVDAAIKSVEGQAGEVAADLEALTGRVDTAEGDIADLKTADTTLQNNIDGVSAVANAAATKTALEEGLADKQDTLTATNVVRGDPEGQAAGNVISGITAVNGVVTYTTASVATSEGFGELQETVADLEANKANAADVYTKTEVDNLQTAQNTTIKADYEAADATVLQTAKDYADANDADTVYDDTEVRGLISAAQTQADKGVADAATAQAAAEAAQGTANTNAGNIETLTNTVNNLNATYATEEEAKAFADAKDAAISAAQAQADKGVADAAAAQADATQALTDAANAQADATQALTDAAAAQGDATKALDALKDTSKMANGDYTLTMKVVDGVAQYGWEYIDRTFEAGEDASTGDSLAHDETTTTQG